MVKPEIKKRKVRRTKEQLEIDIVEALEKMISEKGFIHMPVTSLISEAQIDPNVFYRRYQTVADIYDDIAKKYDFWINESVNISDIGSMGDKAFMIEQFKILYKKLSDNLVLQKLLLWEITDINKTTKRTSQLRDTLHHGLLSYYDMIFESSGLDINCIFALFISGIYYLTLHRGIATFCLIDFSTEEGASRLNKTIEQLVDILYLKLEHQKNQKRMVQMMLKDGISEKKVCQYIGVSLSELRKL